MENHDRSWKVKNMNEWQIGLFDVLVGEPDSPTVCTIAGYYNELFGIDRRWAEFGDGELRPCYVLSHLLTGYNVCAFLGDENEVKAYADEIARFGNWDFIDQKGADALKARMAQTFKNNPNIFSPKHCLPALWIRAQKGAAK